MYFYLQFLAVYPQGCLPDNQVIFANEVAEASAPLGTVGGPCDLSGNDQYH